MTKGVIYEQGFKTTPWRSCQLKGYFKRMSKDRNFVIHDRVVEEMLLAQGIVAPTVPRSLYNVEQLYEALWRYSPENRPAIPNDPWVQAGYDFAYAAFARKGSEEKLQALPMNLDSVIKLTSNKKGSAGLTRPNARKEECMLEALRKSESILRGETAPEPCIAFARTQAGNKTRLVWGYPYSMTILEGLVAKPLLSKLKEGGSPMAFAMPTGVVGTRLRVSATNRKFAYALDMSKFDSSISDTLISFAFKVIRSWFNMSDEVLGGWKLSDVFRVIERYFKSTPILMPNGRVYWGKRHGVPSGSFFTQIVDSIVNCFVIGTVSARFDLNVPIRHTLVLGDDMLFWSDTKASLTQISEFVLRELGMRVHGPEKSHVYRSGETVHFLGRDWANGVPDLDLKDVLAKMVYPERFRNYSKEPERRLLQTKLLILGYAALARSAWWVAQELLGEHSYRQEFERIEAFIYGGKVVSDEHPDWFSGLQRYKRLYGLSDKEDDLVTTVATQFWL